MAPQINVKLILELRDAGISYDAMGAHVAIVFARYMMLSVAQRENEDDKTICELCFCLLDEMEDITISQSMRIIIDALMDAVMEHFHITEQQLENFTAALFRDCQSTCKKHWSMVQRLPDCYFMIYSIDFSRSKSHF